MRDANYLVQRAGGAAGAPSPPPDGTAFAAAYSGASTNNVTIASVDATPGWVVVGRFRYDASEYAAPDGTLEAVYESTVISTVPALQIRVRLVRTDTLAVVAGSTLTFAPPVVIEATQETADLSAVLVDGLEYQMQAEATGEIPQYAVIAAVLKAVFTYP